MNDMKQTEDRMDDDSLSEERIENRTSRHDGETEAAGTKESEGIEGAMPAPTFSTFVLSLASSALVHLGEVPEPATGRHDENLPLAKHTIDILSMLQEKIQKGLDAEEARLLEGLLYELRMKFVIKK